MGISRRQDSEQSRRTGCETGRARADARGRLLSRLLGRRLQSILKRWAPRTAVAAVEARVIRETGGLGS